MVIKVKEAVVSKLGGEGEGLAVVRQVIAPDKMNGKGRMFNHIFLEPGASISRHQHVGETEWYYIMKGRGLFYDNGEEVEVGALDLCITPHSEYHDLKNIGDDTLEMIALILYS